MKALPGIFENKMIVSDIDGTLAPTFTTLPKNNLDAVRRFQDQGGIFTIATGRTLSAAQKVIDLFDIRGPVILNNGGYLYHTERAEYLYSASLPAATAAYVEKIMECPYLLEARIIAEDDKIYSVYTRAGMDNDRLLAAHGHVTHSSIKEMERLAWRKVLFITNEEDGEAFRTFVLAQNFPDISFVASSSIYFEIMPKGVTKGLGLRLAAEYANIKMENTIAIGDHENDLELLQSAGFSAVPENAIPEAKELADIIVCHCRDGSLAALVEHLEAQCYAHNSL